MTLRARVALAVVAVVVPLAVALALLGVRARREGILETTSAATVARMEAGGRERCESRADRLGAEGEPEPRRGRGRGRRPLAGRALVAAYDAEGVAGEGGAPPLGEDVRAALAAGEPAVWVPGPGGPRVAVRMPWDDGPCAILLVEPRAAGVRREGAVWRDFGVALGVLLAALAAAMLALGPVLRRLGLLATAVRASGPRGALVVPPAVRGGDEVGSLAAALEAADQSVREHVGRLEARDRALREYVDGTTHDIALPLTFLLGHLSGVAERARAGAAPDGADVDGAIAASQYLGQLAANLAAAARLDGHAPIAKAEVDLGEVAQRVVERLAPLARHRHVELACAVPDAPATLAGDELLLERAIANLVHNAIRHRPPATPEAPGHVAVVVDRAEPGPRVRVLSDGDPVSDEALGALRRGGTLPDPGRTRGRGLGLRIVRQVADAHGMALTLGRGAEGGLEAMLAPRPA